METLRQRHRGSDILAVIAAMHLCANEAPLSPAQTRVLYRAIRATPGCQEP
jgi:hypothetical protein